MSRLLACVCVFCALLSTAVQAGAQSATPAPTATRDVAATLKDARAAGRGSAEGGDREVERARRRGRPA